MDDEDLDKLMPEDKFLMIGKRKYRIWISAERALKATALFNKIQEKGSPERAAIKTDYDYYYTMLDVAFILIKQDFRIAKVFDWVRRELITKEFVLKHLDVKELILFVDEALEPIIGTKKKELERANRATEAMMLLIEKLSPEELVSLLQNSSQIAGIKKAM